MTSIAAERTIAGTDCPAAGHWAIDPGSETGGLLVPKEIRLEIEVELIRDQP